MKIIFSNTILIIGVGLIALSLGLIIQDDAGEMMPIGLALGAVLVVGGLVGKRGKH